MPTTSPRNKTGLAIGFFVLLAFVILIVLALQGGIGRSIESRIGNLLSSEEAALGSGSINATIPFVTARDHIRGDAEGSIVIVEYGDFECPFCKRFSEELDAFFAENVNGVQHVYRHFPLDSHPLAFEKAHASECVAELGGEAAFWTYHDLLFERADVNGQGISMQDAEDFAVEVGVSRQAFADCQDSGRHTGRIESDTSAAIIAGITGTPSSIILGPDGSATLIPGVIQQQQLTEMVNYFETL